MNNPSDISSPSRRGRRLALLLFCGLAVLGPAVETVGNDQRGPAYRLENGGLARSRIVALGRDVMLDGEARSHVVALSGSVFMTGQVAGDVIVIDGEVHLSPTAVVEGDIFVLGGRIEAAPNAQIGGRSVAYPDASDVWMSLLEGPALGHTATSKVVVGARLALLAFWALVAMLLFAVAGREVVSTSESVQLEPFRNFFVGLTGVLAMVLTALFFSSFAGAILGVPLLVLVAVVALALRFWGMVAVFHALGSWLNRIAGRRPPLPLSAATLGLMALGVIKFLPWFGILAWTVATFIGVGAALSTKLGRREAWFQAS